MKDWDWTNTGSQNKYADILEEYQIEVECMRRAPDKEGTHEKQRDTLKVYQVGVECRRDGVPDQQGTQEQHKDKLGV